MSELSVKIEGHKKEIRASVAKLYALRKKMEAAVDDLDAKIAESKAIYQRTFGEEYSDE